MKTRSIIVFVLLLLAGVFFWRVEWDTAFLPARFNAQMTEREPRSSAALPAAVPFGEPPSPSAPQLYRRYCAACHGEQGEPPAFLATYPGMPAIPTLRVPPPQPATWAESLELGRGAMPAYGAVLTAEQREALLRYLPTLGSAQPCPPAASPARVEVEVPPARMLSAAPARPWWAVGMAYGISLLLGGFFVRHLLILCGAGGRHGRFEVQLLLTLLPLALGLAVGHLLPGGAAFTLPACAFPAGVALYTLWRRGQTEPFYRPLMTTALAVAAYAQVVPHMVASYLPGRLFMPPGAQGFGVAALMVLLLLLYLLPSSPRWRVIYAAAVLLALVFR